MNDRTRWEDARSEHGSDQDRYRQQGGWDNSRRRDQAPVQGQNSGGQSYAGQNHGGQQGGFHDDDRPQDWDRSQDWRGASPYRQDGNWSGQPQQREWRGAERPWGGTTGQPGGYGSSQAPGTSQAPDEHRPDVQRGSGWAGGAGGHGYASPDDIAGRRPDWTSHGGMRDNWRAPGSQSFASGYGMIDGPNYDRPAGGGAGYAATSPEAFGRGYGPDYGRDEGRGFFDRAGDTIASWFGSDEAARRREQDQRGGEGDYGQQNYRGPNYRGHGPSDYTRSDERIREDANDRLTDDHRIDARRMSVAVAKGEITLNGTVSSREAKRRAEDSVEGISGVRHVQNNLRVEQDTADASRWADAGKSGTATTGGTASGTATGTSASGTGSTTAAKTSST